MLQTFTPSRQPGATLAELHLGYERVDPWPVTFNDGKGLPEEDNSGAPVPC